MSDVDRRIEQAKADPKLQEQIRIARKNMAQAQRDAGPMRPIGPALKHFHEMTADEIASYDGDVFTARCVMIDREGREYPNDFQAPTQGMLDELVSRSPFVVASRTDHKANACCRRTLKTGDWDEGAGGVKLCPTCDKVLGRSR